MVREIITLQLGELSNYVATHFWNTQESYFTYGNEERSPVDHNVHWRQGIGADGSETFLPRALIYDFRSNYGPLGRSNPLYENQDDDPNRHLWHGDATVHKQPLIPKSVYHAALEAGTVPSLTTSAVRYWSDFSRPFFHPRSIIQLSDLGGTPTAPKSGSSAAAKGGGGGGGEAGAPSLDSYEHGKALFDGLDTAEDVLDGQLRTFAEESDLLQGMQILVGGDDGWTGFGASLLERVRDEYGKTCVWVWMPEGGDDYLAGGGRTTREKQILRLVNKAKALTDMLPLSTTLVPLSLPAVTAAAARAARASPTYALDPTSPWHVSALLSTALESSTLPARLHPGSQQATLDDLSAALNLHGRQNLARLRLGVGAGRGEPDGASLPSLTAPASSSSSSSPSSAFNVDLFDLVGRANKVPRARGGDFGRVLVQRGDARSEEQEDAVFKGLFDDESRNAPTSRYKSPLAYPIPDSFPPIYRPLAHSSSSQALTIDSLLSTDAQVHPAAKTLRRLVIPALRGDERELVGNALAELAEDYHEGWSSGSDDDDDY